MKKMKALSDLAAITLARAAELDQAKPSEAVLAACDLFMADAVRKSAGCSTFIEKSLPKEKE